MKVLKHKWLNLKNRSLDNTRLFYYLCPVKFDKDHIDKILRSLEEGEGRVKAVMAGGIDYATFMRWMRKYSNFAKDIKSAEETGNDKLEDTCKRRVLDDPSWQSAAWWLERNHPEKYRNRAEMNMNVTKMDDLFPPDEEIESHAED